MTQVLQLQFLQPEGIQNKPAQEEQKLLLEGASLLIPNLNTELNICFFEDNYHLVLSNQFIPLRDGTILKGDHFTVKVNGQPSQTFSEDHTTTEAATAIESNNHESTTIHPDFVLAELNRENSYLELNTLLQAENLNDDLAFLFNNKDIAQFAVTQTNQTTNFTGMLLSGSDPLSLLNQHFQPPEIKSPLNPIAIAQTAEVTPNSSLLSTDGNILRDLGFWSDHDIRYESEKYTNSPPMPCATTFGYRDDEDKDTEKNLVLAKDNIDSTPWPTIKKLWQKLLSIN